MNIIKAEGVRKLLRPVSKQSIQRPLSLAPAPCMLFGDWGLFPVRDWKRNQRFNSRSVEYVVRIIKPNLGAKYQEQNVKEYDNNGCFTF